MTRILLFLNDRSILLTESRLTAHEIIFAAQSGNLADLPPEIGRFAVKGNPPAFQFGELVVIAGWGGPASKNWVPPALSPENSHACSPGEPCLTPREAQVLQALAHGLTIKEIAFRFGIRPRTVREYVRHLIEKFGAQTTEQAVGRGVLLGLCRSSEPPGEKNHPE